MRRSTFLFIAVILAIAVLVSLVVFGSDNVLCLWLSIIGLLVGAFSMCRFFTYCDDRFSFERVSDLMQCQSAFTHDQLLTLKMGIDIHQAVYEAAKATYGDCDTALSELQNHSDDSAESLDQVRDAADVLCNRSLSQRDRTEMRQLISRLYAAKKKIS